MSEWRSARVDEVADVGPKGAPLSEVAPFIAMADVEAWGEWASPSGVRGERGGVRARGGDVLMARITPCLENGKIAKVPTDLGAVGGSTEFIVLRAKADLLPEFLFLWASSRATHHQAISLMTGSTGRQRVAASDVAAIRIAVPPLAEQRRIADLLGYVDRHITLLRSEYATAEALARHARAATFERLAATGRAVPLGEAIAEVKRPIVIDESSEYSQIGIRSHGRGVFTKDPVLGQTLGSKKVFWVEPGDLVINIVFGWEGAVAVVPPQVAGHCGSHRFPTYRRRDHGPIEYVRQYLLSPSGIEILGLASPGGAGRNRTLNRGRLGRFNIPMPSIDEQNRVVDALAALERHTVNLSRELEALRTFRAVLLDDVLERRVTVPESYDLALDAVVS